MLPAISVEVSSEKPGTSPLITIELLNTRFSMGFEPATEDVGALITPIVEIVVRWAQDALLTPSKRGRALSRAKRPHQTNAAINSLSVKAKQTIAVKATLLGRCRSLQPAPTAARS